MRNIQNIRNFLAFSGVLFGLLCWPLLAGAEGQRKAILIGINDYARSAIPDLRGAVNDVHLMSELLQTRMGFPKENIITLTDEQATRENILNALSKFVEGINQDDTVYIHFSGHGSQAKDVNGDEQDGYDETFLPYNARQKGIPDIIDEEFNQLLSKVKTDYALIVFDSCHSGTVTRGLLNEDEEEGKNFAFRAVPPDDGSDGRDVEEIYGAIETETEVETETETETETTSETEVVTDTEVVTEETETASENEGDDGLKSREVVAVESLGYVLMTSAPAHMQALDGPIGENNEFYGIFSYALAKALNEHGPNGTPRQIHTSVRKTLAEMQAKYRFQAPEPQLEIHPDRLDISLF